MSDAPITPKALDRKDLEQFFISHLNRIYCAKNQLVDKLPELAKRSSFRDLRAAIQETVESVRLQINRIRQIYIALDEIYHPESCIGLIGVLDEAFQSIGLPGESASLCDFSILFYMQNIESIEMASFKVMILAADQLRQPKISQLLLECFDEAKEDKVLFKALAAAYF